MSNSSVVGTLANLAGTSRSLSPIGAMRVMIDPTQVFNETWDAGTIDSINKWAASSAGGGVAPSASVGQGVLSSGVVLNGFSKLTTLQNFRCTEPGWLFANDRIQLEFPVLATGHRFWGSGTSSAAPTIAAPLINAMGWELTTAGQLVPVVYASGGRVAPQTTADFKQLADGKTHKYFRWFRGDIAYWCVDDPDNIVAFYGTGAGGPDVNALPLLYQCISNGSTAVTMNINGIGLGDTADTSGSTLLNNGVTFDQMRSNTDSNASLTVLAAQGSGTVNSADQLNVNGRGLQVVIDITAIAAGSLTVTIQGKDIASGKYYTILASAALAAVATTRLTVYPNGIAGVANVSSPDVLPRTWRISAVAVTGPVTATIGASVIL